MLLIPIAEHVGHVFLCGARQYQEAREYMIDRGQDFKPVPDAVREWSWRENKFAWWAVAVAAVLLFVRKPWALITPQLWAEDGPIHLADIDSHRVARKPSGRRRSLASHL